MLFKIALRNTIKNWRHSLSAILSLSAAFVSLVMFDGYVYDVKQLYFDAFKYRQMLGDMIIQNKNLFSKDGVSEPWKFWLTADDQREIEKILKSEPYHVASLVKNLTFQGVISNGKQTQIFLARGYSVDESLKMRGSVWQWNTLFGHPLRQEQADSTVLLGQGLARKMNCRFEKDPHFFTSYQGYKKEEGPFQCDPIEMQLSATTVDGQLNAVDASVVGLVDGGYKDIDDRYIQAPLEVAQALMNTDKVSYISAAFVDGDHVEEKVSELNDQISRMFPHLEVKQWKNHRLGETYKKTIDFLSIFRNFVLVVIVVVSTLSVMNTLVKIVKERTREIGTMRSIGFKMSAITKLFALESLFLACYGIGCGAMVSVLATFILNAFEIKYKGGMLSEPVAFKIALYPTAYLSATLLLLVVGLLSSYLATRQILKSKIVENLNHV